MGFFGGVPQTKTGAAILLLAVAQTTCGPIAMKKVTGGSGSGGGTSFVAPTGASWCNTTSWPGGVIPGAGANVTIPAGTTMVLDCQTASLGTVMINGVLDFSPLAPGSGPKLTAQTIHVMGPTGVLRVGASNNRFPRGNKTAVIELTGTRPAQIARPNGDGFDDAANGQIRALHVMGGGELSLFGEYPSVTRTRLVQHANPGSTSITVEGDVSSWRAGDRIAISTTDFYSYGAAKTEVRQVASVTVQGSSSVVTLQTPINFFRWGRMQYALNTPVADTPPTGISPFQTGLTAVSLQSPQSLGQGAFNAVGSTPSVIDERAFVVNMERPIIIQGADDNQWNVPFGQPRFGGHTMVMDLVSKYRISGAMFQRMGQEKFMGRYPIHWHMLSYALANNGPVVMGDYLGLVNPADHFVEHSAVLGSANRAVTIHGTGGVRAEDNVAVDIIGHAFFLEDGSEIRTQLLYNTAMDVRPGTIKVNDGHAAGFWVSNPDTRFVGNVASDCMNGIWNSFAGDIFGVSKSVNAKDPRNAAAPVFRPTSFDLWEQRDNIAHGNEFQGILTKDVVINEAGDTSRLMYDPPNPPRFTGNQVWKHPFFGYGNEIAVPAYSGWMVADNGRGLSGKTGDRRGAVAREMLFVGESLNRYKVTLNGTSLTNVPVVIGFGLSNARVGMNSYHHTIEIQDITALNYFQTQEVAIDYGVGNRVTAGGFFSGEDMYLWASNVVPVWNYGWRMINAFPGHLTSSAHFDSLSSTANPGVTPVRPWTIGTSWDPYGYWGAAGNFIVPDRPYYTYGLQGYTPSIYNTVLSCSACSAYTSAFGNGAGPSVGRVSANRISVGLEYMIRDGVDVNSNNHTRFQRLNAINDEVPTGVIPSSFDPITGRDVSMHDMPPGGTDLGGARFTTVFEGGQVKLSFLNGSTAAASGPPVSSLRIVMSSAPQMNPNHSILLALPWGNNTTPRVRLIYDGFFGAFSSTATPAGISLPQAYVRDINVPAQSVSEVQTQNPAGTKFYFDNANDVVWIKVRPGLAPSPYYQQCQALPILQRDEHCLREGYLLWLY